jgi:hypothetical protein
MQALLLAGLCLPGLAADNGVAVVIAADARPAAVAAEELALIYRRQKQFLGDQRVQPVNLPAAHPLRRWFSLQVLGRTPEALEDYWRDQYFNGVVPPFVLGSEEAVMRFVAATPGSVGYVSRCVVDKRVKVLLQLEGGPPCSR